MTSTVTVRRKGTAKVDAILGAKYTLTFSKLPDHQPFGPYSFKEARSQLEFTVDMAPVEARNLLLTAYTDGSATAEVREGSC
jgi:hypothetical protein